MTVKDNIKQAIAVLEPATLVLLGAGAYIVYSTGFNGFPDLDNTYQFVGVSCLGLGVAAYASKQGLLASL